MNRITMFPLWLSIFCGGFVLFGVPFLVGKLVSGNVFLRGWYLPLLAFFQFLVAYGMLVFLSEENVTRKAFFRLPPKPFLMAGTIVLGWVSVLLVVSGLLFIVAILLNMITHGEVVRWFSRDMAVYQGAYEGLFSALESRGVLARMAIVLFVAIIIPMTEEWLFRGLLFEGIVRSVGKRWAVVIQAVLFALLHPIGFYSVLYIAIGLMLGWFRVRFDSLWPGIWAHQFQNLIAVMSFLIGGQAMYALDPSLFEPFQLFVMIPFLLVSLFGVVLVFRTLIGWEKGVGS